MNLMEIKMRVAMAEGSWRNFTGPYGSHQFKDGVSVEEIPLMDVRRFASIIQMAEVDGTRIDPSKIMQIAERIRDGVATDMPEKAPALEDPVEIDPVIPDIKKAKKKGKKKGKKGKKAPQYAKTDLEAIADKRGIEGLREIAEKYDVKARSIPDMIKKIIDAQ